MSVQIGTGMSPEHDPLLAGMAAARAAAAALGDAPADVALVFASGSHLGAPEAALEGVHSVLAPRTLVGCGAGGVLGDGREHEKGTALAVWAASLGGSHVKPFHATTVPSGPTVPYDPTATDPYDPTVPYDPTATDPFDPTVPYDPTATDPYDPTRTDPYDLPSLEGSSGVLMLSDPYSFPTEALLERFAVQAPAVPVLGGIASARTAQGDAALFVDDRVYDHGAVGLSFDGIEMLPCVSQGAAPVGREVTITAAEGNVIHELAGRPALETLQLLIAELSPRERGLVAGGLLIGLVIDGGKPDYEQGDFLVRGVLGADPESGALVVGAQVATGQVVRLHARDARSADEDLRQALKLRVAALAGEPPAGAVVFSCNGRGSAMFGVADHDAQAIERELGGAPAAGFFAAGEIGPVGGRSFLHGFTATLAVFPRGS